jgi:hypothetical protein
LVWDLGGFSSILAKNAIISNALKVRGYNSRFVICDGSPEACIQRGLEKKQNINDWDKDCKNCFASMKGVADKYNITYSVTSDFINEEQLLNFKRLVDSTDLQEIIEYKYLGVHVGELAWSSTNRYMKGYLLDINDVRGENELIYRRYFFAALVNTYIADQALGIEPVSVLTSHGVYVDYAPPVLLAHARGYRAVSWASGYADGLHYFTAPKGDNKLQLRGISSVEWQKRLETPLSERENERLDHFIYNRYFRINARDTKLTARPDSTDALKQKLGIDNHKPTVCLFTHVNWDACFDFGTMIFESANQWVIESIRKFSEVEDVNFLLRVHPGEVTVGSLFTTSDLIKREFESIPDHIKILWHDSDINSYGLYQLIDVGITIFGTVGVELPLLGKPVVVAGNAHFSNKGFSIDAKTKDEYFTILENAASIKSLSLEQIQWARQYAYSYFIQRQVPLNIINREQGHWGDIDLSRLEELLPGNDPILDAICEGIVKGKDIILDTQTLYKVEEDNVARK